MATTVNPNYTDTTGFAQSVFVVRLKPHFNLGGSSTTDANGDFSSWVDILNFANITDSSEGTSASQPGMDPQFANILQQANKALPDYFFSVGKCRDTSIGGNDAINCYPQFNETDDIAEHPFLSTTNSHSQDGTPGSTAAALSGMGRVYSEVYDDQQQIMYMTFGVPQFNDLTYFYSNAIHPYMAQIMNNGGDVAGSNLGALIGETIAVGLMLPVIPLVFLYDVLQGLNVAPITKYYDFKSAMPLYYRIVNSTLYHLSTNMNLNNDSYYQQLVSETGTVAGIYDGTFLESVAAQNANNGGVPISGLPEIFQNNGFDIYKILNMKYKYINGQANLTQEQSSDDALLDASNYQDDDAYTVDVSNNGSFGSNFITMFQNKLYDASLYVGFKIEKGVDTSESFSNEVGQSDIAQQVNSKASSAMNSKFTWMDGNLTGGIGDVIGALSSVLTGAAAKVNLIGGPAAILAGMGMVDFPLVWKDSSMSKNYSFTMNLRSPYGDPLSIMQNLYFPLSLIFGGALPRAAGRASYTAPFICRAYCKGMFAVPMGMITSLTVKRGADQYGWSSERLPTCIDVSFQITDLSAAMYVGMSDANANVVTDFMNIFGANSNWQEYLLTLSGMGVKERISLYQRIRRNAMYFMAQTLGSKTTGAYWGSVIGNTFFARGLSVFINDTRLPG